MTLSFVKKVEAETVVTLHSCTGLQLHTGPVNQFGVDNSNSSYAEGIYSLFSYLVLNLADVRTVYKQSFNIHKGHM